MARTISWLKKAVISLTGFPLLIAGIILIPLPGPGVLLSLIALFILSLEFDWANRYLEIMKQKIRAVLEKSRRK